MTSPPNVLALRDEEFPLFDLWNRAVPISVAYYRADSSHDSLWYQSKFNRKKGFHLLAAAYVELGGGPRERKSPIFASEEEHKRYREIQSHLRHKLQKCILDNELVALGFVYPRRIDDNPRRVPSDLLTYNLDWEECRVEGLGLRIDEIRVFPRLWLEQAVESAPERLPEPVISPRKGRPSKRELILEAYEACIGAELIDLEAPKKAATTIIQDWIKLNRSDEYENGRGIGHEVVRQTIADDLDKRRKSAKSKKQ